MIQQVRTLVGLGRLALVALVLFVQLACLDLEHHVTIHKSGAIDYVLRLGLDNKFANGPLAKPAAERDADWKAHVPPAYAQYVDAHSEQTPERVWLVIDAALPDVATYQDFRDAFIAQYEKDKKSNSLFYPPYVDQGFGRFLVRADVRPSEQQYEMPPGDVTGTNTWRLVVTGEAEVTPALDGVLSPDKRTVTFERPLLDVAHDGTFAEATVQGGTSGFVFIGLAAVALAVVAGGAVLMFSRSRAA